MKMNGAEALIDTLLAAGVRVCFANPGTSEMQFVAALDGRDRMRAVLCLFEGVATGAADGYGRMAGTPAATLLHLGAGLGNGVANLHNARRARTPIVNVVGDHATYHLQYDAPLTSDIRGIAEPVSDWVRHSQLLEDFATDAAEAVAASTTYPGNVATLIAPADLAWSEGAQPAELPQMAEVERPPIERIAAAHDALQSGEDCAILLGGKALTGEALETAGRIAEATGVTLFCETFPARIERGGSRPVVQRLPYFAEAAMETLGRFGSVIIAGAEKPVAFFAYPGKPGVLIPDHVNSIGLSSPYEDVTYALKALAARLDTPAGTRDAARSEPAQGTSARGPLDPGNLAAVVARLIPENAIISDEAATGSLALFPATMTARAHDWLTLTGGAIGQGLPLAVGAAIACPDRKVICLQADGSAMYTPQALWTMAREELNITTLILNNSSYAILNVELSRIGAGSAGPQARALLDLSNPSIDWVSLAQGMGVPGQRATTVKELEAALKEAIDAPGPRLVEAILPGL
ncbi:acetolactate synthase large subunit [Pacificimonas sp. WHA3]|uniref:Acetolactate synthase large subunit n=2 Tax=Pacificimonas pallii TaxID=2827236 RepID=A0ABS6SA96_9SPHN|nr:acetolactate synthase large subunit [Pacificimonas pallii]MBV7255313.1 acetolactate synthase large subunit [Pacificimonas pallii]